MAQIKTYSVLTLWYKNLCKAILTDQGVFDGVSSEVVCRRMFIASLIFLQLLLSACTLNSRPSYSDNYPEPCTAEWFVAIEDELKLVDSKTNFPPPGSIQWLKAADEKLSISAQYGHPAGDIEWCHQLHQALIGL